MRGVPLPTPTYSPEFQKDLKKKQWVKDNFTNIPDLLRWCKETHAVPNNSVGVGDLCRWTYFTAVQLGYKGHQGMWMRVILDEEDMPLPGKIGKRQKKAPKLSVRKAPSRRPALKLKLRS